MCIQKCQSLSFSGFAGEKKSPKEQIENLQNFLINGLNTLKTDTVSFKKKEERVSFPGGGEQISTERIHPYTGLRTKCYKVDMGGNNVNYIEEVPNRIKLNELYQKVAPNGKIIISGNVIDPKSGIRRAIYGITPDGENPYKGTNALAFGGDYIIKPDGTEIDLTSLSPEERAEVKKTLPQTLFEITDKGVNSVF